MNLDEVIKCIKKEKDVIKLRRLGKNLVEEKNNLILSKKKYYDLKYEENLSNSTLACWCDSGLNKDECHFRNFTVKNPKIKLTNNKKKYFDNIRLCLKPDNSTCSENDIIRAHSIHKGSVLKSIKDKGNHVYRIDREGSVVKDGHKRASTFFGMCKRHDEELFNKVFENNGFKGRPEEVFMTHYRAIIFELYRKLCLYEMYQDPLLYLECNCLSKELRIHEKLLTINESLINKLEVLDFYSEYLTASESYKNGRWEDISSLAFYISGTPMIGITGMFIPYYDIIRKNKIQSDNPELLEKISITSHLHGDDSFVIIFTFKKGSKVAHDFLKPILNLSHEDKKIVLFKVLFEEVGNIYVKKDWIESLSEKDRCEINRMARTLTNIDDPSESIIKLDCINWNISSIKNRFY